MKFEPTTPAPSVLDSVMDRTADVLRYSEHLLIKRVSVKSPEVEVVIDSIWHVPNFLIFGIGLNAKRLGLTALMVPVWWFIFSVVAVFDSGLSHPFVSSLWGPAVLMGMGTMVFRPPAGGVLEGVRRPAVLLLAVFIRNRCPTEEGLAGVKSALAALQSVAAVRNTRLQTVVGLLWGGLTWWVLTWVLGSGVAQAVRNAAVGWAVIAGIFFVLFFIAWTSYTTASRVFWLTLDLALAEVEAGTVPVGAVLLPDARVS
ncbi:hypothetical protein KR767_18655 [Luteibacter anthropi]|uniref:hypothetical protein n=1 Tax=Luteibacter anthropi TaxID=564369 RepID=UPI00203289EF|nr:hypothetical protein [Luteibacter anthropi]URX62042.1 hypothetical protein KR767_18655 [Luteibacter anthropi]